MSDPVSKALLRVCDSPPKWAVVAAAQAADHAIKAVRLRQFGVEGEATMHYGTALGLTGALMVWAHEALGPDIGAELNRSFHTALEQLRAGRT